MKACTKLLVFCLQQESSQGKISSFGTTLGHSAHAKTAEKSDASSMCLCGIGMHRKVGSLSLQVFFQSFSQHVFMPFYIKEELYTRKEDGYCIRLSTMRW